MTREWAITYDLNGGRGRVYVSTLTRAGALSLLRARFPSIHIVRISEVPCSSL